MITRPHAAGSWDAISRALCPQDARPHGIVRPEAHAIATPSSPVAIAGSATAKPQRPRLGKPRWPVVSHHGRLPRRNTGVCAARLRNGPRYSFACSRPFVPGTELTIVRSRKQITVRFRPGWLCLFATTKGGGTAHAPAPRILVSPSERLSGTLVDWTVPPIVSAAHRVHGLGQVRSKGGRPARCTTPAAQLNGRFDPHRGGLHTVTHQQRESFATAITI
jgi:hypothetical protein